MSRLPNVRSSGTLLTGRLPTSPVLLPLTLALTFSLAPAAAAAAPASAQQIRGMVRDAQSRESIASALVELLAADQRTVLAQTLSAGTGAFTLVAPGPGTYHLRGWRLGADTLLHGPVELAAGATRTLELLLRARPIEVEGIDVAVEARVAFLEREGFYQRRQVNPGAFLTSEEIVARAQIRTLDLLRTVQGLELDETSQPPRLLTRSGILYEQRRGAGTCYPVIYLDGAMVQSGGEDRQRLREFPLNSIVASSIVAVEVYPSAALAPLRFGAGESTCGVIVIWTDAGMDFEAPPPAGAPTPEAGAPGAPVSWDASQEGGPYPLGRVFGGAFLGNALGLGAGLLALTQCIERGPRGTLRTSCNQIASAGAGLLAFALPVALGSHGARRGGTTERSRGRAFPAVLFGSGSTLFGYFFLVRGYEGEHRAERTAAAVLLTLGTPLVVTLADRFARVLR